MHTRPTSPPFPPARWSTSSFGDATDTSPMELAALRDHLSTCKGTNKRLYNLQYAAELAHGFVATRFVTTLALATLLIGGCLLAL